MFAQRMNEIVRRLQWPIATLTLVLTPVFIAETLQWLRRTVDYPVYATMFWLGFALVYVLFRSQRPSHEWLLKWIARERQLSRLIVNFILLQGTGQAFRWLQSWILGNRRLRKDQIAPSESTHNSEPKNAGDDLAIAGENWLALCAPFFLPSAPMLLWLASALILPAFIRCLVLGAGLAYHLLSVYVELRHTNPIHLQLDRRLIWCFIFPMNIVVFGITYAFALKGFTGITSFLFALGKPLQTLSQFLPNIRSLLGWSEST